ncbi:hypothetical protein Fmac_017607 [Flemingia macrophylla]|uniref:Gp5/Type VI secretion system Vgr C-terminal trimerisation domain-containing protein n=1 Tax=Flemingia macrophylla TaxID=520843 RepID=A0ABD1M2K7_9FABA
MARCATKVTFFIFLIAFAITIPCLEGVSWVDEYMKMHGRAREIALQRRHQAKTGHVHHRYRRHSKKKMARGATKVTFLIFLVAFAITIPCLEATGIAALDEYIEEQARRAREIALKSYVPNPFENNATETVKNSTTEPVKNNTTELVKGNTTQPVKNNTTELVKGNTTEPVKCNATEPVKNSTTEPVKNNTTK